MLRGDRLEQRAERLDLDVHRQQSIEQGLLAGLVLEIAERVLRELRRHDGQDLLDLHHLADGALELVVDQINGVELFVAGRVLVNDGAADLAGAVHREVLEHIGEVVTDVRVAALEVLAALLADHGEDDLHAFGFERLPLLGRGAADARVERAGQAAVRGEHHQHRVVGLPHVEERVHVLRVVLLGAGGHHREHVERLERIRTQLGDRLLRPSKTGRGDQLHRARDLLRVLDAADALADVFEVRHCAGLSSSLPSWSRERGRTRR